MSAEATEAVPAAAPAPEVAAVETTAAPAAVAVPASLTVDEAGVPVIAGKTAEEVQSSLEKAAKQIYFYFSDSNLPVDKFFFSLTACNDDGWVPIKTILTFKRMREFQDLGVDGVAYGIRQAAAAEGTDPLVAVSEDNTNVRRVRPLEPVSDAWSRSVYVKGFGEGDHEYNTLDKIEEWFAPYGRINAIRMRREDLADKGMAGKNKGAFKGSVFAEFAYKADMDKFLENKEVPKFRDEDMLVETKEGYVKRKCEEKGITPDDHKPKHNKHKEPRKFNAFREMERAKHTGKGDFANIPKDVAIVGTAPERGTSGRAGDFKRKREDGESEDGDAKRIKEDKPVSFEYKGVTLEISPENGTVKDPMQIPFEEGGAVKLTVEGEGDWKALKEEVMETAIPDVFMGLPAGQKVGTIAKQDGSKITDDELAKLRAAELKYGGNVVSWERMSEDEQREFWTKRANYQAKIKWQEAREAKKSSGGGNWKGRGGGRGGKFGRGRGRGGRGGRGRGGGRGDGGRDKKGAGGDGLPPSVGAVGAQ